MIVEQEKEIIKGKAEKNIERIVDFLQKAAEDGKEINSVEKDLWTSVLSLGRDLLEGFIELQGSGDLGEEIEHDGRRLRRLDGACERRYVSVFGEIKIGRAVYGVRQKQKYEVVPLDMKLNLPAGDFSYLLQEWDQAFCVKNSFAESCESISALLGIGQSVRSLEKMNLDMSGLCDEYFESRDPSCDEEEGEILVFCADGKGVPMRRPPGSARPGHRLKKGEKPCGKRMACVGAAYSISAFRRTADDVIDEVLRVRAAEQRPSPQNKRLRAELTREINGVEINGKDRIFSWFSEELERRDPSGNLPVVFVMDGERALWKQVSEKFPCAVCVLDIYHVLEYLWKAAHCFHVEGSSEAEEFVIKRLRGLLEGRVGRVIGGLRQMATKHKLSKPRTAQLQSVINYLSRNADHLRYDEYLSAGYPIGSGVCEGACRHLVKDRMELTGMRWQVPGAQAMLSLRSVYLNGDWSDFQRWRIENERKRLYPYEEDISKKMKAAA